MEEAKPQPLEQIKAFLDGASEVAFRVSKEDRNPFIERVLMLLRYIGRMIGLLRICPTIYAL